MSHAAVTHGHTIHWARLYDVGVRLLGRRVRALHERVLEVAALSKGEHVLDVGCGPGLLTLAAAAASGDAQGIDASPEMIALAQEKASRAGSPARFQVAGIEALPQQNGSVDVVLANLMLHHLPAELQRRGVAEVFRVLRPGGRFIAGDFMATPGHGLGHVLTVLGLRRGTEHAEHLRGVLAAAGFAAVRIERASSRAFCVLAARKPAVA